MLSQIESIVILLFGQKKNAMLRGLHSMKNFSDCVKLSKKFFAAFGETTINDNKYAKSKKIVLP